MRYPSLLALALFMCGAFSARAQAFLPKDHDFSEAGGWNVYWNAQTEGCFAERTQPDGTRVLLGTFGKERRFAVGFDNGNMGFAQKDKTYKTKILFDQRASWDTEFFARDFGSGIFLFGVYADSGKFRGEFARGNALTVDFGRQRLAQISLKGSSAALKAVDDCLRQGGDTVTAASAEIAEAARIMQQAIALHEAGQFAQAEPLYRRALAIIEKALGPEHPSVATSLNNLANLLRDRGDLAGAEPLHRRALAIREKALGPEHADVATSLNNLAVLLDNRGDLAGAEPLHRRALAIKEKALGPEHADVAAILNNLAILLRNRGDLAGAEPLHRRALAIKEKALGPEHPSVAGSLNNLAVLLSDRGDLAGAEPLHRRALAIKEKALGPEHADVAAILNNLAILLRNRGDLAGAEPLYRRALAIWEKALGPEHPSVAGSLNNLANLLWNRGDLAGAEPLHRRALAIREKALGPEHPSVAGSLNNLANLLWNRGDLAGAEPLHRRALAIYEKALGPEHADVADSLNNLANLLSDRGDLAGAEPLYRRALAIKEKALGPEHPSVTDSLNNLAILLRDRGDLAGALELSRRSARAGHPRRATYLSALSVAHLSLAGVSPGEILSESFLAIQTVAASAAGNALQSLAVRASAGGDALAQLVRKEQDLAGEQAHLEKAILVEVSKEPDERKPALEQSIRDRTQRVSAEIASIRDRLGRDFPDYAELSRPAPLPLIEVRKLLQLDEALIVLDIAGKGDGDDYVWAVTQGAADWRRLATRQGAVAESVGELRARLDLTERGRPPVDPAVAHSLYRQILAPVASQIAGKKHLLFVLNGAISSLPPQVLVSRPPRGSDLRDVAWLARDYAITVLPTVSSLKLLRQQAGANKAPKPFRGYGDPVFNPARETGVRMAARGFRAFFRDDLADVEALRGLPRLPGTGKELKSVAKSLGVPESEIILGKEASEKAVKQARLSDYNIVYFATHGLVAGEVEQVAEGAAEPALALSVPAKATDLDDGLLTASEVAQLKLNADWVVMSACNTAAEGRPGADALSGLARAFFYAGARSLLVSHWVVDDDATAELMSRTFAYAAKHPDRRQAEALRQAMLSVMNDPDHPEWADPGFWAPFILVGEARRGDAAPAVPDAVVTSGWAVQVFSRRSAEEAESTFRALQARFPDILRGRQNEVQRAEVDDKGTFFRVRIRAETKEDADNFCNRLKAAGGSCFVTR